MDLQTCFSINDSSFNEINQRLFFFDLQTRPIFAHSVGPEIRNDPKSGIWSNTFVSRCNYGLTQKLSPSRYDIVPAEFSCLARSTDSICRDCTWDEIFL